MKKRFFVFLLIVAGLQVGASNSTRVEPHAKFQFQETLLNQGIIQYGLEWIAPENFKNHPLFPLDFDHLSQNHPGRNQIVLAKLGFVSQKSRNELSLKNLNRTDVIKNMFDSFHIEKTSTGHRLWSYARAYGLNFQLNYHIVLNEINDPHKKNTILKLFNRSEKNLTVPYHIIEVKMDDFSRLMYQNNSYILIQERSNRETLVQAVVISSLDRKTAQLFFPMGRAQNTMLRNMENQILFMSEYIQKL